MNLRTRKLVYDFFGAWTPGTSADNSPWKKRITGAAPPTVTCTSSGMALALTADSQAQVAGLYWGDILSLDIDDIIRATFQVQLSASLGSGVLAAFGLASAANSTFESIAAFAAFKCSGDNNVDISTDDGTTDTSDVATGTTLSTTRKEFTIDFASGINTRANALSTGGKGSVIFSGDVGNGLHQRLCPNQLFDMSAYSGGLQPYFEISKASGTDTGTLTVRRLILEVRD